MRGMRNWGLYATACCAFQLVKSFDRRWQRAFTWRFRNHFYCAPTRWLS